MKEKIEISIGYEGPTDACLVLTLGEWKREYLIESLAWRLLSSIAHLQGEMNDPESFGHTILPIELTNLRLRQMAETIKEEEIE